MNKIVVKNVIFWYDLITFLFIQTEVDNSLDYNYDDGFPSIVFGGFAGATV